MSEIYALSLDGEAYRYVGFTSKGVESRLRGHWASVRQGSQLAVHLWMRKHGPDSVIATVLETCEQDQMPSREIFWIAEHRTFSGDRFGGLNLTRGGEGVCGLRHTVESRAAIGAAVAARPNGFLGKKHTVTTLAQMSASHLGAEHTHLGGLRGGALQLGKKRTPEQRAVISEIMKQKWADPTYRAKMKKAQSK